MTIQREIIRKSVTREETESAGVFRLMIYDAGGAVSVPIDSAPPLYWTPGRDVALRRAYRLGGQWASAVNIAVTRIMSAGYEVGGDVALRVRRAREMIGASWIDLTTKLARDYVTTDNGCFVEVVRATKSYGSRVLGLVPLSSARCVRTGDPETPVIYIDRNGKYHELRDYQVAEFSDLPDEDFYGVGLCATSRAWDAIYEDMAVKAYFREKATGRRSLAIYLVGGMGTEKIEQGLNAAQEDANRKGSVQFMGSTIIGNANAITPSVAKIPLAELPDGFNQDKHEELMQIRFANSLGLDPSELNPRLIGNRALGAGSQARVLDEKQESKGLISLRQKLLAFLNDSDRWHVLPGGVTFAWSERDLNDQMQKAQIAQMRAATRAAQITSGEITADQARQLAVDEGDLPETFIQIDTTDEETLTDEDKADGGDVAPVVDASAPPEQPVTPAPTVPVAPVAPVTTKEAHTGAMVALYPSMDDAEALAVRMEAVDWPPGAKLTEVHDYHVTLAYLGEAADIPDERRTEMIAAARKLAATEIPNVRFNGVARFDGSDEDGDAIVILLSDPTLNDMADIARRKIGNASEHTFNAHMTIAYIPKAAPTPTVPPPFDAIPMETLTVVFAGEATDIPIANALADSPVAKELPDPKALAAALASFKAASTQLAALSVTPSLRPRRSKQRDEQRDEKGDEYWREVTKGFDEIGRLGTIAMRQEIPQRDGEMARSIRYTVTNKNTSAVTLRWFVGNKERPEVSIRAVLFGRKGFGPKRAEALSWVSGGKRIYARKVKGALANDWFSRAMKALAPAIGEFEGRLGAIKQDVIDVADVPGAIKRTRQSQIQAPRTPKKRSKK